MQVDKKNRIKFWAKDKSLSILLIILVVHIFIIIPFGQQSFLQVLLFLFFYLFLISAGILYMVNSLWVRIVLIGLLAFMVIMSSGVFHISHSLEMVNNITIAAFCLLLGAIVLMRTFGEGPVTIHRIQGAIIIYLLISFIFGLVYHSLYLANGQEAFRGLMVSDRQEFMYFSLTTITTTGYGDITPVNAAARSLTNLESLIGQLYPVILISRLVAMELETSRKK
jgi:voltage-gated potassium channel Kch